MLVRRLGLLTSLPFVSLVACTTTTIIAPAETKAVHDAGVYVKEPAADRADAGTLEAAPTDPVDPHYPSAHATIPPVDFQGGPILEAISVVTVTFAGDPLRARLEEFGDTITATPWWDAVIESYCSPAGSKTCVGRGSGGGHAVLAEAPPAAMTDSAMGAPSTVQDLILQKIVAKELPAPTQNTLYAIYLPANVSVALDSAQSCQQFGAYHNTLKAPAADGTALAVAYAIMPRCDSSLKSLTVGGSHELIEAATDPQVGLGNVGYYMNDQLWGAAGGEVGDVCVDPTGSGSDTFMQDGFIVQRSWSNSAAKASHDPCVPAPEGQAYFNVSPPAKSIETAITAVGKSVTIELDAFSDGPMPDWDVTVLDAGPLQGSKASLEFTLDRTKAHNGSKLRLDVKLVSKPSQGFAQYYIVSRSGRSMHYWPAVIATE